MLKYEVIRTLHELEPYEEHWSNILKETNNDNPFVEFEWISTWWEIVGRSQPVEIYIVKNGDEPVAFFPFEHVKRLGIHCFRFLGTGEAFYMQVISCKEWLEKSIQFLLIELEKRYRRILFDLDGLLESKDTSKKLEQFAIEKQYPHSIFRFVTPFIDLNEISDQQYMKNIKKKTEGLDHRERRLQALGELTFQPDQNKQLDEMFKLYDRTWERKVGGSKFSTYPTRKFMDTLVAKRSSSFHVEVNYLMFENRLIGFTYDLCCRGRKVSLKMGHEPDFNLFGPDKIIDKENLERTNKQNFSLYDFGMGTDPYKLEWATNVDFTRRILMCSNGKREKFVREIRSLNYFVKWKIRTNHRYVVLKRDKLGEILHFIKVTSLKEKVVSIGNFIKRKASIIEIYKLEENNLKKSETSFVELKIQDVLQKSNQAHLIPYYYRGYQIFSKDGQTITYKRHNELIRDEETGLIEPLPPNSIFIKDYKQSELLAIVCELGNENCSIWTVVNRFALKKRKMLKSMGFKKVEQILKYPFLNWQKGIRKQMASRK